MMKHETGGNFTADSVAFLLDTTAFIIQFPTSDRYCGSNCGLKQFNLIGIDSVMGISNNEGCGFLRV